MAHDDARRRILDAFGVTEDDLAALNADGWADARAAADREREDFIEELRRLGSADIEAFGEILGGNTGTKLRLWVEDP